MADPVAVWSGEMQISGVTLHVHVLDNGERIIDVADFCALMEAWGTGAEIDQDEVAVFARWQRGLGGSGD